VLSRGDDARFSRNETDRAASKRLIECLRKRSASDARNAEGADRLRFDGEILQRLISKYPRRAKHRQRGAEAMTDEDQVLSGRAVIRPTHPLAASAATSRRHGLG